MCEIEPCEHEFVPRDFPKSPLSPIVSYQCSKCGMRATKATHTPSITVGTQVRLTGVVRQVQPNGAIGVDVYVGCQDGLHWFRPAEVEVIRQPFKRGEVVWNVDDSEAEPFVVVNDESEGVVDVTNCRTGSFSEADNPEAYERRP